MNAFTEVTDKLNAVKNSVEGNLKILVEQLQAIFHHVHSAPVEDVVKTAVAQDIHTAVTTVQNIADTLRSDADTTDTAIDSVDSTVDAVAK